VLDHIAIRWRLAIVSAALTFVILAAFAVVIGQLTASRVRSDFNNQVAAAVDDLSDRYGFHVDNVGNVELDGPDPDLYAASTGAVVRVLGRDGHLLSHTSRAPNFGIQLGRTAETSGYRVETRVRTVPVRRARVAVPLIVQYGRRTSEVEATVSRVRLFLGGGVLGGTLLALLGGLIVGRRAMAPIASLTAGARDIAETRDPGRSLPRSRADDEVAELGRTLQQMLDNLEASRTETEEALARQRQFVADPRTSCARRSRASSPTWSCSPRSSTASAARRPSRRCARPSGCAAWSATSCSSPAPTRTAPSRTRPPTSPRSSSTPPQSSARSPTATS
jgi:two-component system OmpR family sensor kinase